MQEYTLCLKKREKNLLLHLPVTTSSAADTTLYASMAPVHKQMGSQQLRTKDLYKHNSAFQASRAGQDGHKAGETHQLHPQPWPTVGHQWSSAALQRFTSIDWGRETAELPRTHSSCNCVLKATQPCSSLCFTAREQGHAVSPVSFPSHLTAPCPGLLPTTNTHQDTLHCPVGDTEPHHVQEETW